LIWKPGKKARCDLLLPKNGSYVLDQSGQARIAAGVIFSITVMFFWPRLRGRTFSMVGAHMFAQYPWGSVISGDLNEVRGFSFAQTDHPDGLFPVSLFATNAVRGGQLHNLVAR
jgi:hypothetical protein